MLSFMLWLTLLMCLKLLQVPKVRHMQGTAEKLLASTASVEKWSLQYLM